MLSREYDSFLKEIRGKKRQYLSEFVVCSLQLVNCGDDGKMGVCSQRNNVKFRQDKQYKSCKQCKTRTQNSETNEEKEKENS